MIVQLPTVAAVAEPGAATEGPEFPPSLDGARIGLLDNSKAGAAVIVEALAAQLAARGTGGQLVRVRKTHASLPLEPDQVELLAGTDVVIAALGDCGSCTSYLVHDSVTLEKRGVPVVAVCSTPFEAFASTQALALDHPRLRILTLEHPIAELPDETVRTRVADRLAEFDAIVGGAPAGDGPARAGTATVADALRTVDAADDDLVDLLLADGATDGLPVVPPTADRVAAMLAAHPGDPDEVVGRMPPKYGVVTPRLVAANAVLAGCLPAYLPVVLAGVRAMLAPEFNLNGIQTTTHPCAAIGFVSGPITERIGMNSGINAFGPGNRANATIGRALRLCMLSLGGARPGDGDMATLGTPAKYGCVVAENTADSPWPSLAEALGGAPGQNAITMIGGESPQNVNDHESKTGLGILRMVAGTMRGTGMNNNYYRHGQVVVVLSPEHARSVADAGYDREQVQRYLWGEARTPVSLFSRENVTQRLQTRFPEEFGEYGAHTLVPVVHDPTNILVCVVGGPGKHSMFIPTFGATRAVSRLIDG